MSRFLAIALCAFISFATTGAHRAVAAVMSAPSAVVTVATSVKAPCCKSYRAVKTQARTACQLPPAVLASGDVAAMATQRETHHARLADVMRHGLNQIPERQPPRPLS